MADEGDLQIVDNTVQIYWCGNWTLKEHLPKDWRQRSEVYRLEQLLEQDLQDRRIKQQAFMQWFDRQKTIEHLNIQKQQIFQALMTDMRPL